MSADRRRGWRLAAGVVVLALLAAACQGGGGDQQQQETGPVELTLLDHQKPRVELMKQLLPKFEQAMAAQGRQITVKLLEGPAPDDQFTTKLTLDFNSGNAADVSSFGTADAVNFGASGFLLDLTDRVKQWPDWEAHFYPRLREEQVQADGKVYAIPREATIQQLFYRKDVLEREGISTAQPRSWQELLERMRQATEAIGAPALLFPAGTAWGGGTFGEGFVHLMLGTGSPLYQDGKWVVRSPGLTQVLQFYEQMTTQGVLPVQPLLNPEPWVATKYKAFPAGKLVATTCGTWCWMFDWGPSGAAPIKGLFDKVATWEFPTAQGGETFVWGASGWVWGISEKTRHPDAAWELVKWLASGEAMARNAVTVGAAAPRDDLAGVKPYSDYEFLIAAEKQLAKARSFTNPEGVDKFGQAVGEATEAIITKKADARQAADMLAERATELLGERNVTEL